jgi:hypothetical protein
MNWYGEVSSGCSGPVPSGSTLGLRPTAILSAASASAELIALPVSAVPRARLSA